MTEHDSNGLKEELLEDISELFLKYGLRSTSMDDICSHLKISKKTLYQFFSNKDDVVEQVFLHRRENPGTQQRLTALWQHNAVEIMFLFKEYIIERLNSNMPTNLFDLKKYHPDVYQRLNEKHQIFVHDLMDKVIEKGIRENNFREDIRREVQIYLFVKQMAFLEEPEMLDTIKYPIKTIISTIIENMIRSFATMQGMEEFAKQSDRPQNEPAFKQTEKTS